MKATGERARLFPVLSESSKEGRTLAILLATLAHVPEFADAVLRPLGRPVGGRTRAEAYTEVKFADCSSPNDRPDGLLVVTTGKKTWRALIEAKVGNAKLNSAQIESYLTIAREVNADAVITISNDFTASPNHHPISVDKRLLRKTELFHISWFSFLTALNLLSDSDDVEDNDHRFLLDELERFLVHPSAGLQRFTQMSGSWSILLDRIRGGLALTKKNEDVFDVSASWQSELRDLCLLLSRKTGAVVDIRLPPKFKNDPSARLESDCQRLVERKELVACLVVPNAATNLDLCADLASRTIRVSAQLAAPEDKVRQASRLTWLLKQLEEADGATVRIQSHWPGRAPVIETSLAEAREDPALHSHSDRAMLPHSFSVVQRIEDGRRFIGRSTFITELEELTINFYDEALSQLKAWQAPAPKLRKAVEEETEEDRELGES